MPSGSLLVGDKGGGDLSGNTGVGVEGLMGVRGFCCVWSRGLDWARGGGGVLGSSISGNSREGSSSNWS